MRNRIFWLSQLVMALVLLIYAVFSTQIFYAKGMEEKKETLKAELNFFDETLYPLTDAGAQEFSDRISGHRVTWIDGDGNVLGDSQTPGITENHLQRQEVAGALADGFSSAVRQSSVMGKELLYCCRKTSLQNGEILLVRVAVETQSAWAYFADQLPALGWFLVLDFFVCLIFSYLQTQFVLRPVKKVAKEAALNMQVETKYSELRPVVDLLNKRNQEVAQKLEELSDAKERSEKMQRSKNDFIANITHEMNTPLTSIKGYAELLAGGMLTQEQSKQAADILLRQSDRLANLIACVIDYQQIDDDNLPLYDVDASVITREILESLAPDIKRREIALHTDIEEKILLTSRQERMREVVGNLIRNAVRYNKDGGALSVSLQRTEKGARLTVADTGVGIAEENLERIFDRFYTVDTSHNGKGGGFGLGLAVVKKICKVSGWVIRVDSKLDEGATFTVDFM